METKPNLCPQCQAELPAGAPEGLCPRCLLEQAAATETSSDAAKDVSPPDLTRLKELFPELSIHEMVGRGGMGVVYRAAQERMQRSVALKVMPEDLARNPEFAERFTREAQVLAQLSHPNIVALYDFGEREGLYYLTMEFMDGVNLRQAMQASQFTPEQALKVVPRICDALEYAHERGVLHRDIKPANILLNSHGDVKLADFGIAKLGVAKTGGVTLTQPGGTLGTPHYMAPEQIEKPSEVDHRADIYSLGVVFYEMLTGELPLGRFAPPSKKSDSDEGLDSVVLRALEKEREARQQSAGEMKSEVETVAQTSNADAAVGAPGSEPPPTYKISGPLFWVAGIVLVAVTMSFTYDFFATLGSMGRLASMASLGLADSSLFSALGLSFWNQPILETPHNSWGPILGALSSWAALGGIVYWIWSQRVSLLGQFQVRHPVHRLSLYPLLLFCIVIAVASQAVWLLRIGTADWLTSPLTWCYVAVVFLLLRRGVPAPEGKRRSAGLAELGLLFLIWAVAACFIQPLLSPPSWVWNGSMLSRIRSAPGEMFQVRVVYWSGILAPFIQLAPIGLALITQSRAWRTVAIAFTSMAILGWLIALPGMLDMRLLEGWHLAGQDVVWILSGVVVPIWGLALLTGKTWLAHFGLRRRDEAFFGALKGLAHRVGWSGLWRLVLLVIVVLLCSLGYYRLVDLGVINPDRYVVKSFEIRFQDEQFEAARTKAQSLNGADLSLVAVSHDVDGATWWTPTGEPLANPSLPSFDLPRGGDGEGTLCHLLFEIRPAIAQGFLPSLSLASGDWKDVVHQDQFHKVDAEHQVASVRIPAGITSLEGELVLTDSNGVSVGFSNTFRQRQLGEVLTFDWGNDFESGDLLLNWMNRADEFSVDLMAMSSMRRETRILKSATRIDAIVDGIEAEFENEYGPHSTFHVIVRPRRTWELESITLSPRRSGG